MNVNVTVALQPDGSVKCKVECDGREAKFILSDEGVLFEVPQPAGQQS